jgi:hypothetical protein
MIVFIVPIKSPQVSSSWDLVCRLFERTAKSVCNQTTDSFRIIAVCNQKPEIAFHHPNIDFCEVDFPLPAQQFIESGIDPETTWRSPDVLGKELDKSRKIKAGLSHAEKFSPTHAMVVDADDCISRHIAAYVNAHPSSLGWYVEKGYLYHKQKRFLQKKTRDLYKVCGSSIIVRFDQFNKLFIDDLFYEHRIDKCSEKLDLQPFPLVGTIYEVAHGENLFQTIERQNERYKRYGWLLSLKNIFRSSQISQSIRDDFSFYTVD